MGKIKKNIKSIHWSVKTLVIGISFSFLAFLPSDKDFFEISKNLDVFTSLFKELNIYYVDETKPGDLMKTGIDAMLESLDPYTNYYPESDIEDYRFMTTGKYGGIGSTIRRKDDFVIISEPYENFPAHKAGLKAGDVILKVDGKEAKGKNSSELSELLKGQPGTEIELLIQRSGASEDLIVKLKREEIKIKSVPYYAMLNDSVGYVNLTSFTRSAGREVKTAILELKEKHGMKKLVFDLRGNPGGLLRESIKIVNFFVKKGQPVVSTKGKVKDWNKVYKTLDKPIDLDMPVVVLINENSASASEIVSGSLQDLDRAVVVGQRSFGKGLVQTTRPLTYNSKLKLTTAKYYTPSGRCIQAIDYSHRDKNGRVHKMPDSLITEYKTANGRSVFDGAGVTPDTTLEAEYLSSVAVALIRKNQIFDFVTHYVMGHETIDSVKNFKLADSDWTGFMSFIEGQEFDFETSSDKAIEKLEKSFKNDKYDELFKEDIAALHKKLDEKKKSDFKKYRGEITQLIEREIVTRYYYQKGKMEYSLQDDKDLEMALNIMAQPKLYKSLLQPVVENK